MKKLTEAQRRKIKKDRVVDLIFLLSGIMFFAFTGWIAFNNYYGYEIRKNSLLAKFENKEVKGQQICMYRNKLNVGPSIPVVIDGETYYVCCQGCGDKLKQNYQDSQYGEDKFSHHRIKKTKAFIALTKKSQGKVSYFESEENFNHFK
ncbi:hypothetical protein AQPE_4086 [Aquipluma nitroreducens]|uniref:TRASH transcription regulator C-terminal archaeal domain-containing protein n=1 Tax=Aquipluma nitroreducens TaxID=2010828 RepID=A0A5K7SE95_9BACT|nr:hypothetical protein [Aquipluma nitroreducens]BBE19898.1 hypothetical protein AQPE_4086 [Aquipluma nitroreducens]